MPQTLYLLRHAQGFHNLSLSAHSLPDPLLTEHGKQQCQHFHSVFPHIESIDLIVASPLKRTIYTALHTFSSLIQTKNLTIIALPELQETGDIPCDTGSDIPCDTGSDIQELEREFAGQPVDLRLVEERPDWNCKVGEWAPEVDAIDARTRRAREWLRGRKEGNIVVVSHGTFLHYLTGDFGGFDRFGGSGWEHMEVRPYIFDGTSTSIVEKKESRKLRTGEERLLTETEQRDLKMKATESWIKQGLIKPSEQFK